jgi:ankyrin repeat protein
MKERWLGGIRRAVVLVAVLLAAGCANLPGPGSRLDSEALLNALVDDREDYVRAAIEARLVNANSRIPAPVYAEGTPLITVAARAGAVDVVRYLIQAGAAIDAHTPAGETALMLAAYFPSEPGSPEHRHAQVVRLLIQSGAQVDNHPNYYSPLAYAAYQGREPILKQLLERGARVDAGAGAHNNPGYTYVNTPLMMAAMQGHAGSTVLLLRAGADARVRVVGGHTAAELAAKYQGANLLPLLRCAEATGPGPAFAVRCEQTIRAAY